MKVLCDREKLREGLAIVNNVIPPRSPKPVLENVCLVATDHALELVGTDLEVAVRYRIEDVKVAEPGVSVLPARVALDFIRDLASETVTLSHEEGLCTITGGADSCELVTIDQDEYPVIPRFDDSEVLSIQGGTFTRLAGQTAFAAAREAGRYAMHGVLITAEGDDLTMVGTDGRRLALARAAVDMPKGGIKTSIVPTKGIQLFCRVIDDPLDMVQLEFGENQVGLKTKNAEIFARLIDGEYPKYSQVIPSKCENRVEASTDLLGRKLRLVANVTGDEARAVRFKLQRGELELFGRSVGRGEAHAHMEVAYDGAGASIAFNPDYVLDGIKHCDEETLRLEFTDMTSPGKFSLGESFIYIVMPITIDT
ncbi:MAG: DNA polymerase III subunit beta [Planctomycetes bacterium]|nr:DNA polymerase III subunit beta [Planctomycetota bacterium]